jgi:hypothetical protein
MTNPWIEHVKKYAQKKNMSYSQALKDPKVKQTYKKVMGRPIPQKKGGAVEDDTPEEVYSPTTSAYRKQIKELETKIEDRALRKRVNMVATYLKNDIEKLYRARFYLTDGQVNRLIDEIGDIVESDASESDKLKEFERIEKYLEPHLLKLKPYNK